MAERRFDLVVLGGGPGGYVAAIRAAQLGMSAALVEREALGGICLNWGCIPTKALLRASEINHLLGSLDAYGLSAGAPAFDLGRVVARSRAVAARLSGGIAHLLRKNKVTVFEGVGRLDGPGRIALRTGGGAETLAAPHVVLATGARPRGLPGIEPDGKRIWTYREAMTPPDMPGSVLVLGAGAIGIEFASFYRDLGAEVTVVEAADRILPAEDEEISALALKAFEAQGMSIHTGASVGAVRRTRKGGIAAAVEGAEEKREVAVDRLILAVGIVGNAEDLGIEGTGVAVRDGHVMVDGKLRTGESGIYALGDLAGPPWLAHKASREGIVCVEEIAGLDPRPVERERIPACTYCRPQIASVGLTEAAARAAGRDVKTGRFPYLGNGKAIALGDDQGLVKTVFDGKTGALLGAHMIGAEVTELIQGFAIAKTLEATEAELIETVFPHPTLSEAMHEAVLDAFGRTLHL